MTEQKRPAPAEIRAFRADNPQMRERDIAARLKISEAALFAAETGISVTRIDGTAMKLLERVAGLGEVMALSLLDEPVSSLDISHQLTIMSLARSFCERGGGVIAVMHDLNLTALFADRVVLMKSGHLAAAGSIREVLTDEIMLSVFGCALRINQVPPDDTPFVLAHSAVPRR